VNHRAPTAHDALAISEQLARSELGDELASRQDLDPIVGAAGVGLEADHEPSPYPFGAAMTRRLGTLGVRRKPASERGVPEDLEVGRTV